jgi:sec-independent protein translocase protein TatA
MLSSVLLFFEFSAPEIMLILFVTLLLFGGDKLPGLAKGLGKGIREFKDASEGVKREINNQIENYDKKREPVKVEETPRIAEHSTDNLDGTAPETPVISPVANTVPVGESLVVANDDVTQYERSIDNDEELYKHYRGGVENQEPTSNVVEEPAKKENV